MVKEKRKSKTYIWGDNMVGNGLMYHIKDNNSHVRMVMGREDTIQYIKEVTGDEYNLNDSLRVISSKYDITVTRLEGERITQDRLLNECIDYQEYIRAYNQPV